MARGVREPDHLPNDERHPPVARPTSGRVPPESHYAIATTSAGSQLMRSPCWRTVAVQQGMASRTDPPPPDALRALCTG